MKFRPTPNLLTGIFMGIFSLTTLSTMAEKAVETLLAGRAGS